VFRPAEVDAHHQRPSPAAATSIRHARASTVYTITALPPATKQDRHSADSKSRKCAGSTQTELSGPVIFDLQ
jgi:hypothetical protein